MRMPWSVLMVIVGCGGGTTANPAPEGTVSVLRPTADASIAIVQDVPTAYPVRAVALGDMDGDGDLDVVACGGHTLEVFAGKETGEVVSTNVYETSASPGAIALADLDGDGDLDVALAAQFDVTVYPGDGHGGLGAPASYAGGGRTSIAVGDINDDGLSDLVIPSFHEETFQVLDGLPGGAFAPPRRYSSRDVTHSVMVTDVDRDGRDDVVTSSVIASDGSGGPSTVSVFRNRATLAFGDHTDYPAQGTPPFTVAGDFNGDGAVDLVATDTSESIVVLFPGDGAGGFRASTRIPAYDVSHSIEAVDFNRDSLLDLAITYPARNAVGILENTGNGGFGNRALLLREDWLPLSIAVGDLGGDGTLEMVVGDAGADTALE